MPILNKNKQNILNSNNIHEFKVMDFGEMFKYICQNYDENIVPFPSWFMKKLDSYTSSLNIKDIA